MARPKSFDPAQAIREACLIFWQVGYTAASIDALMAAMRISRQSLYDTYGDKQALFAACLRWYEQHVLDADFHSLQQRPPLDHLIKLIWRWSQSGAMPDRPAGCLLTNSLIELPGLATPNLPHALEIELRLQKAIRSNLDRAAEEGEIPPWTDTQTRSHQLAAGRHALMLLARAGANPAQIKAFRELLIGSVTKSAVPDQSVHK